MAERITIARPYAEAAFQLAEAGGKLAEWSAVIANLALVAQDARVVQIMHDPKVPAAKVAGLFISILGGTLSAEAENFVRVLAENQRLDVLAEIRELYDALKNEHEGLVEAEIRTAFPLDDTQLAELRARIEKSAGRKVRTRVVEDKSLLAGVRVSIGDRVIDGSARAQLASLAAALTV